MNELDFMKANKRIEGMMTHVGYSLSDSEKHVICMNSPSDIKSLVSSMGVSKYFLLRNERMIESKLSDLVGFEEHLKVIGTNDVFDEPVAEFDYLRARDCLASFNADIKRKVFELITGNYSFIEKLLGFYQAYSRDVISVFARYRSCESVRIKVELDKFYALLERVAYYIEVVEFSIINFAKDLITCEPEDDGEGDESVILGSNEALRKGSDVLFEMMGYDPKKESLV